MNIMIFTVIREHASSAQFWFSVMQNLQPLLDLKLSKPNVYKSNNNNNNSNNNNNNNSNNNNNNNPFI